MHARLLMVTAVASLALAGTAAAAPNDRYAVRNMVSNNTAIVPAERADPLLVNPWGLAASAGSPWWPANQGSNTSTITPATNIPNPTLARVPGGPTGIVAGAGGTNFPIPGPAGRIVELHLQHAGRRDPWLARRHPQQRLTARDLARERGRGLHGAHDRDASARPARGSTRPTSPTTGSTSSTRSGSSSTRRARSSTRTCPPATAPTGSRRSATGSSSRTPARPRPASASSPARGSASSTPSISTAPSWRASRARAAS